MNGERPDTKIPPDVVESFSIDNTSTDAVDVALQIKNFYGL